MTEKRNRLHAGDVVKLKSGGPSMTISEVGTFGQLSPKEGARCKWFDGTKLKEDFFVFAELKIAAPTIPC